MKYLTIILAFILITFSSCGNTSSSTNDHGHAHETTEAHGHEHGEHGHDHGEGGHSHSHDEDHHQETFSVEQTVIVSVERIHDGKDGYMAELRDASGATFSMLVSIPNMGDKYVRVAEGNKIEVVGMHEEGSPTVIRPTSIKIIKE